jgi:hypothetical protein
MTTDKSYNRRLEDIAAAIAAQAPVVLNLNINPTGVYNGATAYLVGDSVSYQGSSYIALAATTGNLPTNTAYWQLLAQGLTENVQSVAANGTDGSTAFYNYTYICTGTINRTRPTCVGNTNRYTMKNNGSGTLTITAAGGETVEGAASITVGPGDAVNLASDGVSNWIVY